MTINNEKPKTKAMKTTQEPKHTLSEPTRLNHTASRKQISISAALMAALLSTASPGTAQSLAPVDLGWAGSFVILSKAGITDVPTSAITGNVGTSPITGAAITGLDCVEVTGTIFTVDAAGPACRVEHPSFLTVAVGDMETAYTDAAGRPFPDVL